MNRILISAGFLFLYEALTCAALHTSRTTPLHTSRASPLHTSRATLLRMAERPLSYSEYLAHNRGSAADGPPSYAEYLGARSGDARPTDALQQFASTRPHHEAPTQTTSVSESVSAHGVGEAIAVDIRGQLPQNAVDNCDKWLGMYTKRRELVNGRASYVKAYEATKMIWHVVAGDGTPLWTVGRASDKGEPSGSFQLHSDTQHLEDATGPWWVYTGAVWVDAPHVHHRPILDRGPADDGVPAASERAPEALPPRAPAEPSAVPPSIRLTSAAPLGVEPLQRPTEHATEQLAAPRLEAELEARVANARALCATAVDERARPLMQSAIDDFMAGEIDAVELERCRDAARTQTEAEYPPLNELYHAFAVYAEAAAVRATAERAEATAEARLDGVLRTLEQQN